MTTSTGRRPDESVTEWGIRMVRETGAAEERERITGAIARLFDGRHCVDGNPGCACELVADHALQDALRQALAGEA